ncbi:MAG: gfo/Idh/MocA family oxidoreductase [Rickettsiales bacterium TMED289]|nr:MAG: gfo/Idh/MocA family oxidoreductase [Rickettsiales bacterium TMED289]|tara:strand:+ start:1899 stop:2900 length:1002 start_codon:yes stop_codon:yes gene_type:complete
MKNNFCDYLVVGTGNIAKRHISNLKKLFQNATVGNISSTEKKIKNSEADIVYESLLEAKNKVKNFVIIASPSSHHLIIALPFMKKNIPLLIEKPISNKFKVNKSIEKYLLKNESIIDVGYNFRFNDCLNKFKEIIDKKKLIGNFYSVIAEVGQFLPDWRENIDYKKSVTANRNLGGGVLLELSHELDYLSWIFGKFDNVYCKSSNSGLLEIDVEDNIDAILSTKNNQTINLHMDFLQRAMKRKCTVHGEKGTITLDLIKNNIIFNGPNNEVKTIYEKLDYDKNEMYLNMILYFDEVRKKIKKPMIGVKNAFNTVNLIEQMKKSSLEKKVVNLD